MIGNLLKTTILLASLSGLLLFLGGLLGGQSGITVALIIAIVMNGITYFYSDKIVLRMYGAQPLNPQTYSWVYAMVKELAQNMQMPMPKLWLINTPMANAFATGRNPNNASVALTTSIMQLLTQQELRGVLAHELSHVKNRDILISTIAATMATAIGYIARMVQYKAMWQPSNDRNQRTNPLFALFIAILMPIAATLIQLAISRSREFQADESGAECCKDPLALAAALEKLSNHIPDAHLNNDDVLKASTAPLFIVHPFTRSTLTTLFSTHPPMEERIARLKAMYDTMR